ncbi:hypothetical protein M3201_16610 [Paenibacillus motobuensis]|uniref:hypothetical protein n=1 Tax=Paenibacillus TaxID=44249 RepID=UPI00203BE649|nr:MULTISPECIES: hypothetical protein [Paenibacillus]MCM3041329.1 hypothetical protein [Paenibacillus lutimineralis]MCM3648433.1 hypothetical protein [Paenibacillus motobuensis]
MKWMWRLFKLSVTAIVVSLLTVMTTGYVVNSYIQSLLSSYNIPIAEEAPTLGGMFKGMLGFGGKTGNKVADKSGTENGLSDKTADTGGLGALPGTGSDTSSDAGDDSATNGEGSDKTVGGKAAENDKSAGTDQENGQAPEDSVAAMGGISSQSGQQGDVLVTPDDLIARKDQLPDQEKEEVFKILMTKLPQEEMQKLTEAMEDGLTETEMIEIEQVLSKYLDKTEYTKMMNILKK